MLSWSFAIWGTALLCMPSNARRLWATMLMRVIVGIAQGFLIPSIHTVLSLVSLADFEAHASCKETVKILHIKKLDMPQSSIDF